MTLEQRLTGIKEIEPGGFHVQFSFVFKNGATEVASESVPTMGVFRATPVPLRGSHPLECWCLSSEKFTL
jgi:hypothetical protein